MAVTMDLQKSITSEMIQKMKCGDADDEDDEFYEDDEPLSFT